MGINQDRAETPPHVLIINSSHICSGPGGSWKRRGQTPSADLNLADLLGFHSSQSGHTRHPEHDTSRSCLSLRSQGLCVCVG